MRRSARIAHGDPVTLPDGELAGAAEEVGRFAHGADDVHDKRRGVMSFDDGDDVHPGGVEAGRMRSVMAPSTMQKFRVSLCLMYST